MECQPRSSETTRRVRQHAASTSAVDVGDAPRYSSRVRKVKKARLHNMGMGANHLYVTFTSVNELPLFSPLSMVAVNLK